MRVLSHSDCLPKVFGIFCKSQRAGQPVRLSAITGPGFPGPVRFDLIRASVQAVLRDLDDLDGNGGSTPIAEVPEPQEAQNHHRPGRRFGHRRNGGVR